MIRQFILPLLAFIASVIAPYTAQANGAAIFNVKTRPATDADILHAQIHPMWLRVLQAEKEDPAFTPQGRHMSPGDAMTWRNLVAVANDAKFPNLEVLRMINGYFNQWPSRKDEALWDLAEYWASPKEFFQKRAGDCEDYAIAKYFALRYLKVDANRMRILVVRRKNAKGVFLPELHAVLAVYANNMWFILDNNARPRDNIFPHTMYNGRFVPMYSVNENGAWLHDTWEEAMRKTDSASGKSNPK